MRAILVLIVAAGAAVPAVAADKVAAVPKPTALEPAAEELVGAYKCVGDAGAGKEYHGSVEIDKVGDCYRIKWTIGAQHYTGLAIRDRNTLSTAIRDEGNPKYMGLAVYRIEQGGKLVGRWTILGSGGALAKETLTPEK